MSGVCVQGHCWALGSHRCMSVRTGRGPVCRGQLSQILTPKVIDTSSEPRRGRGSGRARTSPQDTGLLALPPPPPHHLPRLPGCPCVCECSVSAGLCWRGRGREGGNLCSTDCLSSELMDPLADMTLYRLLLKRFSCASLPPQAHGPAAPSRCPHLEADESAPAPPFLF